MVRARRYPWGIVEVDNPKHSDFGRLRSVLLNTHLTDLKEITHDFLYENYRTEKLSRGVNASDAYGGNDSSILPEELATQSVRLKEEQLRREGSFHLSRSHCALADIDVQRRSCARSS
jgi:cell division control protein 11